jgi:hypothetical protein
LRANSGEKSAQRQDSSGGDSDRASAELCLHGSRSLEFPIEILSSRKPYACPRSRVNRSVSNRRLPIRA